MNLPISLLKKIVFWLLLLALASVAYWAFMSYKLVVIQGDSMFPTLHSGDKVLVSLSKRAVETLEPDDIIIFDREGDILVKRVRLIVGNHIWVLGDNRQEALDSREFGPIKRNDILGVVIGIE